MCVCTSVHASYVSFLCVFVTHCHLIFFYNCMALQSVLSFTVRNHGTHSGEFHS